MSDPSSIDTDAITQTAKHVGSGSLGALLLSLWHRWQAGKREEKLEAILNAQNVQLAVMAKTLDALSSQLSKHELVFADVVKNGLMLEALHRRVDALEHRKPR